MDSPLLEVNVQFMLFVSPVTIESRLSIDYFERLSMWSSKPVVSLKYYTYIYIKRKIYIYIYMVPKSLK